MAPRTFVITHDTTLQELEKFIGSGGDVKARARNPTWYETSSGQYLALNVVVVLLLTTAWIVSWILGIPGFLLGLILGPALFATADAIPKRFLLGYDKLEASWKLSLLVMLFFRMPYFWMKLTALILIAVAVVAPSIYHAFQYKNLGEDNTLLHLACFFKAPSEVVKLLIESGADVNARNSDMNTPLHFAVGDLENTQLLLINAAEVEAENEKQDRPIDLVKKAGVARALLDAGSRGNSKWQKAHEIGSYKNLQMKLNVTRSLKPGQTLCFLSHHKQDAAASAVYLHGVLCSRFKLQSDQVFLDSNALEDLRNIINLVQKTKTLVVVQTKHVLTRPFCLAEMFTAISSEIPIICVSVEGQGYDFEEAKVLLAAPSFRAILQERSPGAVEILEAQGFDVDLMGRTIAAVIPNVISKPFNPSASERVRGSQIDDIVQAISEKL